MLAMSDAPASFDCQQCIARGRRNTRGRECLKFGRDLKSDPIPYKAKVRNQPEISGFIRSEEELDGAIERILRLYQTEDFEVALRRIGRGFCPKSYPISPQSFYFLDLYYKTYGGEYGTELRHLPLRGGALDQPSLFYAAMDVIVAEKYKHIGKQLAKAENQNKGSGEAPNRPGSTRWKDHHQRSS